MINLSQITFTPLGECTGFTIVDNTNYGQLPDQFIDGLYNLFTPANFELGVRLINIVYPDGTNQIFCTNTNFNGTGGVVITVTQYNTSISNLINYSQVIRSFEQGNFTVQIVAIPLMNNLTSPSYQTNAAIGDLFCSFSFNNSPTVIFQALVNNPTTNFADVTQWKNISLLQDFQLIFNTAGSTPYSMPADYLNTLVITQDCYLSSLECVLANIDCAYCKECGCGTDIKTNQSSVRIIKASLLSLELNLLIQQGQLQALSYDTTSSPPVIIQNPYIPDDSYLNKVCKYSKAIYKLCNCMPLQPCSPCDTTSESEPSQLITQQEIANAINDLFSNNFVYSLLKQVTLGKKICCDDEKSFLALITSQVIFYEGIEITAPNYNCLNKTLNLAADNEGYIIVNSQGNLLGGTNNPGSQGVSQGPITSIQQQGAGSGPLPVGFGGSLKGPVKVYPI
jgi:hypothetical protein